MRPHEQCLVDWLIERLGDGNQITLSVIWAAGEGAESASQFIEDYNAWGAAVTAEAKTHDFFESIWRRTPTMTMAPGASALPLHPAGDQAAAARFNRNTIPLPQYSQHSKRIDKSR